MIKLFCLFFAVLLACSGGPVEKVNFSGNWALDEGRSDTGRRPDSGERPDGQERQGRRGGGFNSPEIVITQTGDELIITRTFTGRDGEKMTSEETYDLTGKESVNESRMGTKISVVKWEEKGAVLVITSEQTMERGDQPFTMNSTERWSLQSNGEDLQIESTTTTPRGERTRNLYYTKF